MASQTKVHTKRILVIENEFISGQSVCPLLQKWGYSIVGLTSNREKAVTIFLEKKPDLVLVETALSGPFDGIEIVESLNRIRKAEVIYLSNQTDKATLKRAKATKPIAYLLKPFHERQLRISIDFTMDYSLPSKIENTQIGHKKNIQASKVKANTLLRKGSDIFLKQNYQCIQFKVNDILYIEADRNHSYIVTTNHRFVVRISLSNVLEQINTPNLQRVHRSFAVSTLMVQKFDDSKLVIKSKTIPISSSYRDAFWAYYSALD